MLRAKGILLFGVLCGSLSPVFVRWATAPSMILVCYRMFISALLLLPGVLRHHREIRCMPRRVLLLCLGCGVVMGFHFIAYFEAIRWTSVAASAVLINTEVLFVALGTVLIFHKRLSGKAWFAIFLTFAGSALVAMGGTGEGIDPLRGNFLAVLAAGLIAVYTMVSSVCRKDVSNTVMAFIVYFVAAITVLITILASDMPVLGYGTINYAMALCLAVFCTLLGHSVYTWSLKYLSAAVMAIIKMANCVFGTIWGILLFREFPSVQVYIGGVMVIFGIILYNLVTHKAENPKQQTT